MTLGGRRFLLVLAVAAASLCLALGVSQPFVRLTSFSFFTYEHSPISAVSALMRSGQLPLAAVVLVFAIFLPVMRLLYLLLMVVLPLRDIDRLARQLRALEWLGKWSLLDVVALSLTIALLDSWGVYDARGASGAYFFTAAVTLMLLAHAWLRSDAIALRARAPATTAATRGPVFALLPVVAAALFALGVMLPAIRLSGGYAGADQHSLATLIRALYGRADYFPCFVLFTLAILFPCLKLLYLLALVISRMLPYGLRTKSASAIGWLGGHAIAEVMVLALMAVHVSAAGRATLLPGAYYFAASTLVAMLGYGWASSSGRAAAARHTSLAARLAGLAPPDTPANR